VSEWVEKPCECKNVADLAVKILDEGKTATESVLIP